MYAVVLQTYEPATFWAFKHFYSNISNSADPDQRSPTGAH